MQAVTELFRDIFPEDAKPQGEI
jgi:hypothetical protein